MRGWSLLRFFVPAVLLMAQVRVVFAQTTTIISDAFSGADGTALTAHAPNTKPLDRSWVVSGPSTSTLRSERAGISSGSGLASGLSLDLSFVDLIARDWRPDSVFVGRSLLNRTLDLQAASPIARDAVRTLASEGRQSRSRIDTNDTHSDTSANLCFGYDRTKNAPCVTKRFR